MGHIRNLQLGGSFLSFMYLPICYFCCERGMDIIVCMQLAFGLEILLFIMSCICIKMEMNFPFGRFFYSVVIPMLLVGIITFCVVYCVRYIIKEESFVRLILSSITSLVFLAISAYFIGINDSEKRLVKTILVQRLGISNHTNNIEIK